MLISMQQILQTPENTFRSGDCLIQNKQKWLDKNLSTFPYILNNRNKDILLHVAT